MGHLEGYKDVNDWLIELGFRDKSTLVGHLLSSSREREKRDRRDSRGDEREGQGRKENEWKRRNRINKNIPHPPLPATKIAGWPIVSQYQLDALMTYDTFATPNHPEFDLEFYGQVNPAIVMLSQSVDLVTIFMGRLNG